MIRHCDNYVIILRYEISSEVKVLNTESIQKAEILISAVSEEQYPSLDLPEIAIAGRSNVGKSSLINTLLKRQKLARTSSKPGRTRTINFYNIEDEMMLVDVPGYGYAKVSKKEQAKWADMMDEYFRLREELVLAILIIDFRHGPTDLDFQMYDFLKAVELPVAIVATKADKVKRNQRKAQIEKISSALSLAEEDVLTTFSSQDGSGRSELWDIILDYAEIRQS